MIYRNAMCLAFAAACLTTIATVTAAHAQAPGGTQTVTNGPQTNPGDVSPNWSARQNVIESERYDRLLETNRGFREARMRKECGPITDAELRSQCIASFGQDEPFVGSSTPPRSYRSNSGS